MQELWEITLPMVDNSGHPLKAAHAAYSRELVRAYGGYTSEAGRGAWAHDGKVYREPVRIYRVASPHPDLAKLAAPLFPDQLAFFVSHVGEAETITHKEAA